MIWLLMRVCKDGLYEHEMIWLLMLACKCDLYEHERDVIPWIVLIMDAYMQLCLA